VGYDQSLSLNCRTYPSVLTPPNAKTVLKRNEFAMSFSSANSYGWIFVMI
jgi:hypothetical protein